MITLKELGQKLIDLPNNNYIITDAEIQTEDDKKAVYLHLKKPDYYNDNSDYGLKFYLED